jgi:hypothetical protein
MHKGPSGAIDTTSRNHSLLMRGSERAQEDGRNNEERRMKNTRIMGLIPCLAVMATLGATGCGHAPLKTEASTSAIRAAEEVGAGNVPRASLHLQLAKEGLENAKKLSEMGEKEKADSMLMRAEADAELAVALSHEENEKTEAVAAVERVRKLRQENAPMKQPPEGSHP